MEYFKKIEIIDVHEAILNSGFSFSNIRKNLFLSIFFGEYYNIKAKEKLDNFSKIINDFQVDISTLTDFKISKIDERIELLRNLLSHYNHLVEIVNYRMSNQYSIIPFNFEIEHFYTKFSPFENSTINEKIHWVFVVNIKLAEIDEGYCVNEKNIQLLSEIYHKLDAFINERSTISFFAERLKQKCSILLYKILKRLQKTKESIYQVYNDDISINKLKKNIDEDILNAIEKHYTYNDTESLNSKILNFEEKINTKKVSVSDIHEFVKFIKRSKILNKDSFNEARKVLSSIQYHLENKIKSVNDNEELRSANLICYQSCLSLVFNCVFKIEVKQQIDSLNTNYTNTTLSKVFYETEKKYIIYKSREEKNHPNFILTKLYINSIINLIEICKSQDYKVLNDSDYDTFDLIKIFFEKAYLELKQLKQDIKTCEVNRIMPLYLEIEYCKTNKFFIDSNYILPSNYEYLMEESSQLWDRLKMQETILYSIIPNSIREINREMFKKEVKEHQYNLITIIALYSSFITFILANINVLPELIKHSIGAVLAFMLVFGVILFYFVVSIKVLFTTDKMKIKNYRINYLYPWVIATVIISSFAFLLINKYINNPFNKNKTPIIEVFKKK